MSIGSIFSAIGKSGLIQKAGKILKSDGLKNLIAGAKTAFTKTSSAPVETFAPTSVSAPSDFKEKLPLILGGVAFVGVCFFAIKHFFFSNNSKSKRRY